MWSNWVQTDDTVRSILFATVSLNQRLVVRTGITIKWVGTTNTSTPIDRTLLASACPAGQRAKRGVAAACEDCPEATYEEDGVCRACVSVAIQTLSALLSLAHDQYIFARIVCA